MGVPGLWDLLRPAATRTSLSSLAKTAYQTNRNGLRALTIGVDASLWVFHAQVPTMGKNPFLRTILFKICALLQQPVLPVFVFDGPDKPRNKRGQTNYGGFGTRDKHSRQFKELLDQCGLEWWNLTKEAPGEAEAELAVMNRQGKIDAVLSDDVDALLFGATCILRNNSASLSGTGHVSTSKGDSKTYEMYRSSAIHTAWTAKEGTTLRTEEDTRMAMIFVALFAGGDYVPEGMVGLGPIIAFALAHAGMSDELSRYTANPAAFASRIPSIHARIVAELRTNASGHIGRKNPVKANSLNISQLFPESAMESYLRPATSPRTNLSAGWPGFGKGSESSFRGKARNTGRGDLEGMARACEMYFEWGTRELVAKKFVGESTGVFGADLIRTARRRRMDLERRGGSEPREVGGAQRQMTSFFQPSNAAASSSRRSAERGVSPGPDLPSYLLKIERVRDDPTCPELKEYRILYQTEPFVERTRSAMIGDVIDPKYLPAEERLKLGLVESTAAADEDDAPTASQGKADAIAKGNARFWIADWLVKDAWPSLVDAWEDKQAGKKVVGKGRTKAAKKAAGNIKGFFAATQAETAEKSPAKERFSSPSVPRPRSPTARPRRPVSPVSRIRRSPSPISRTQKSSSPVKSRAKPRPIPSRIPIEIFDSDDEPPKTKPIPKRKALVFSGTPTPPRRTSPRLRNKPTYHNDVIGSSPIAGPSQSSSVAGPSRLTRARLSRGTQAKPLEISSDEESRARTVSPPDSLERALAIGRKNRAPMSPLSREHTSSPPDTLDRHLNRRKTTVLSPSSHHNASSSNPPSSPLPPGKTKTAVKKTQQNLGMPNIASSSQAYPTPISKAPSRVLRSTPPSSPPLPSLSPSKSRTAARSSPSPIEPLELKKGRTKARPRPSYVILDDGGSDGNEVIDCTRGGRLLDGSNWK